MSSAKPKQIREFEDEVPSSKRNWTDPALGKPSFEDFRERRVAVRDDLVNHILQELESKDFCVISGPRDSGKTWLSRAVAFKLNQQNKNLKFVELDEDFDAYEIWSYIKGIQPCYFIVENCHRRMDQVADLVTRVADPRSRKFLFTGCDVKALLTLGEEACWIRLKTGDDEAAEHIRNIIKKFIDIKKKEKKVKVEVADWEIEAVAEKWKDGDLHDVYLRLTDGWHFEKGMKLSGVEDESVFKSMFDINGKWKLGLQKRLDVLLALSTICQFESAQVWDRYVQNVDKQNALPDLESEGIIQRNIWQGNSFLRIGAGKASWILRAIAWQIDPEGWRKDPKSSKGFEHVHKETLKEFKNYIRQKPPNWSYVLYCVRVSREVPLFIRGIRYETKMPAIKPLTGLTEMSELVNEFLHSIFEDQETWKAIQEMLATNHFFSLSLLPSLSKTFIAARQVEKEQDIVQSLLQKDADHIVRELHDSHISVINDFLSFILKRNRNRFYEVAWRIDVKGSKLLRYKEATVQAKCELCSYIPWSNRPMINLVIEDMQKQLKESTASNVREVLREIHKINGVISKEEFFDSFLTSDWENIIRNSSKISPILHLLHSDLPRQKPPLIKMAVSLSEAFMKSNLTDLVTQKQADPYGLVGIIDAARNLNVSTKPLVESILRVELGILKTLYVNQKKREAIWATEKERFAAVKKEYKVPAEAPFLYALNRIAIVASEDAQNDPRINEKIASLVGTLAKFDAENLRDIFRDVGTDNYFFPHPAPKAPEACRTIMKKIGFDTWLILIQSALRDEKTDQQAFWLLWNILRYDDSLAKELAKKSKDIFLENVKKGRLSEASLPLKGLLNHLKVGIDDNLRIDFQKASDILESFIEAKSGYSTTTMILLSLIALRSMVPREKFDELKEKAMNDPDVENSLHDNRDTQLQSVFTDLIRKYQL